MSKKAKKLIIDFYKFINYLILKSKCYNENNTLL